MWTKLFGVGDLEPRKFVDLVVKLGIDKGRLQAPTVDYDDMRVVDGQRVLYLGNVYESFLRTPRRARIGFIEGTVLAEHESASDRWEDVIGDLLPVVRAGAYLTTATLHAQVQLGGDTAKFGIARKELAPGVFATLAVDRPTTMAVVQESQLPEWGKTFDEAFLAAQANLRRISQDPFTPLAPGVWVAPWGDAYAAARVLVPDVLQRVCSDPLVCMPTRDTLFLAEPTTHGFEMLVALLSSIDDKAYAISRRIYQLVHHQLQAYTPPESSPARLPYEEMVLEQDLAAYATDKQLRERLDDESFYASLMAYKRDDGTLITRAVWTKDVDPSFLPPAQRITFVDLERRDVAYDVPWEVVAATPGMLTPTGDALPRYRAGAFPSVIWLNAYGERLEVEPRDAN